MDITSYILGLSIGKKSGGKPIEVTSEEEMNTLLAEATDKSIGSLYLYTGETTETYTQGMIYVIEQEGA